MLEEMKALAAGFVKRVREQFDYIDRRFETVERGVSDDIQNLRTDVDEMKDIWQALKSGDLSSIKAEVDALAPAANVGPATPAPQPTALAPDAVAMIAAQHGVAPAVVQAAADAHAAPAGAEPVAAATAAAVSQGASEGIAASIAQAVAAQAQPVG